MVTSKTTEPGQKKGDLFALGCNRCGNESLSVNLIVGHGVHAFCEACQLTAVCLTVQSLTSLIAHVEPCKGCSSGRHNHG